MVVLLDFRKMMKNKKERNIGVQTLWVFEIRKVDQVDCKGATSSASRKHCQGVIGAFCARPNGHRILVVERRKNCSQEYTTPVAGRWNSLHWRPAAEGSSFRSIQSK